MRFSSLRKQTASSCTAFVRFRFVWRTGYGCRERESHAKPKRYRTSRQHLRVHIVADALYLHRRRMVPPLFQRYYNYTELRTPRTFLTHERMIPRSNNRTSRSSADFHSDFRNLDGLQLVYRSTRTVHRDFNRGLFSYDCFERCT